MGADAEARTAVNPLETPGDALPVVRSQANPRPPGRPLRLGLRRAVERTNSWLSNYGRLRRNTDRRTIHRLAQLALAIVLTITAKLIDCHDRWNT